MPIWLKIALGSSLVSVLLSAGVGYKIHGWRVDSLRSEWATEKDKAVKDAVAAKKKECEDNGKITKEQNHAITKVLSATTAARDSLLRAGCLPTSAGLPGATGGFDDKAGDSVPSLRIPITLAADLGKSHDDTVAYFMALQNIVAYIYTKGGQADKLPAEWRQ